ncbi:MAG: peptidylprolyl isomerase [Cellvibrionaceae bacterium]|nr:peptidylprolyl isomerase [Cellvibrionaceae bacterium]
MMKILKFTSVLVLALTVSGLSKAEVLLKGNGFNVTDKDVQLYIDNLMSADESVRPDIDASLIMQVADLIYATRVLAAESKQHKEVKTEELRWMGDFQENTVLKEWLLNIEARDRLEKVNFENTAKDLYEKQKQQFITEKEVRAAHILIRTLAKDEKVVIATLNKIRDRALAGEDFLKLAKENSEDPSAKRNSGDLGFFSKGKMVKAFEEVAFTLKDGEVSEPIKTPFGYHLIKVTDRRGGGPRPFEEVKNGIIAELKKQLTAKYKSERLAAVAATAETQASSELVKSLVKKYSKEQEKKD